MSVAAIGESNGQSVFRDPDVAVMMRVRADEPGAFAELVEKYQHRLVGVLHHVVGDAADAEDLAQEVFLRVYRARKRYQAQAKFSTWLFTIANNVACNAVRTRQRRPAVQLSTSDSGPLGPRSTDGPAVDQREQPAGRLDQQELAALVRRAVDELNDRQRIAVILNKFEDMPYAEIAAVMNLSTKAVKSLLSRARTNLRIALEPYIFMDGKPVSTATTEMTPPT